MTGRRGVVVAVSRAEFVGDCVEGYEGTLFEYWDGLSIRGFLQRVVIDVV